MNFTETMPLKPIYWDIRVVVEKYGARGNGDLADLQ